MQKIIAAVLLILALCPRADATDKHRDRENKTHVVCKQGITTTVYGEHKWRLGIAKGWWTDGPCEPPEPPKPPEPPIDPPPPPMPDPLQPTTIKPGPMLCKSFPDVRGADVLVFTNAVGRPNVCNVWKYRTDGTLFETASFELAPREKQPWVADWGFNGWWEARCAEPWKGARLRANLMLPSIQMPTGGATEREAFACLE